MATYGITGVGGFIGSHLARRLLQRGQRVVGIDDFSGGQRHLLRDLTGLELHAGSITDAAWLARCLRGVDFVLHHAALASVPACQADPQRSYAVNVEGTRCVLAAARQHGVQRVVFASSSAIYGDAHTPPLRESLPAAPLSAYAEHKCACEALLRDYQQVGVASVTLRYFNVYGPGQNIHSSYAAVIPQFLQRLRQGLAPLIYGDGTQSRDFTYIDDVVQANWLACHTPQAAGGVFNIACGTAVSVNSLAAHVQRCCASTLPVEFLPARPADIRYSCADIRAARQALDFQPRVALAEGIQQTVQWYLQQPVAADQSATAVAPA